MSKMETFVEAMMEKKSILLFGQKSWKCYSLKKKKQETRCY